MDWLKVKQLAFGVVVGALVGGVGAPYVSASLLKGLFALFAAYVGLQMLAGRQPKIKAEFNAKSAAAAGAATGALSSWVGIGGGALIVPFLLGIGAPVKQATGISSAIGVPVALAASLGYAWSAPAQGVDLPGQLGFVHLAAACIVSTSLIGVFLGVKWAQKVPALALKRFFALTLLAAGAKMLVSLI